MKTIRIKMLATAVAGVVMANSSWGALTQIQVASVNGTAMNSSAYNGSGVIASSGWAGSWTATIKNPQPSGYYIPPSPYSPGYTFTAFCTDIGNTMGNGTYNYEALAFSSASLASPEGTPPDPNWANALSGGRAAWLYNTFVTTVNTAGFLTINNLNTTQADRRAAMAIGIWELLYENIGGIGGPGTWHDVSTRQSTGIGTRSFMASGSSVVLGLANYWIDQGEAVNFPGYDYTWFAERQTPDVQSLVGPWAPIPEPTTVLAGALLLLPFAASTIRFVRKNRSV